MSVTLDEVVAMATALPEVELTTSWNEPAFKVRGKLFARRREPGRDGEPGEVWSLWTTADEKAALVAAEDPAFFTTPHYDGYDMICVRAEHVDPDEMAELLTEAWRLRAPKRLVAAFDAAHPV